MLELVAAVTAIAHIESTRVDRGATGRCTDRSVGEEGQRETCIDDLSDDQACSDFRFVSARMTSSGCFGWNVV